MNERLFSAILCVVVLFLGSLGILAAWTNSAQQDGYKIGYAEAKAGLLNRYAATEKQCQPK